MHQTDMADISARKGMSFHLPYRDGAVLSADVEGTGGQPGGSNLYGLSGMTPLLAFSILLVRGRVSTPSTSLRMFLFAPQS